MCSSAMRTVPFPVKSARRLGRPMSQSIADPGPKSCLAKEIGNGALRKSAKGAIFSRRSAVGGAIGTTVRQPAADPPDWRAGPFSVKSKTRYASGAFLSLRVTYTSSSTGVIGARAEGPSVSRKRPF